LSAQVDIKITAYDANRNVLGTKIITVSAAGSITADITSLFSNARRAGPRSLRQVVVNGKQVTFGLEVATPNVAVNMDKTTTASVTYTTAASASPTPRPTLNSANSMSIVASVLIVCATLLLV
jgi:hypothetical protein